MLEADNLLEFVLRLEKKINGDESGMDDKNKELYAKLVRKTTDLAARLQRNKESKIEVQVVEEKEQESKLEEKLRMMQVALNHPQAQNLSDLSFRQMPVIPTIQELLSREQILLKPNIIDGAYPNLEEYLSTNFLLLREDFVRDFKVGIQVYMKHITSKNKLVSINNDAIIQDIFLNQDFFGLELKIFLQNRVLIGSDKLKNGSLVAFSPDNFRQHLFFGVVRHNDMDSNKAIALEHGFMTVGVQILMNQEFSLNAIEIFQKFNQAPIVVIESKAFFESYSYSLTLLKNI